MSNDFQTRVRSCKFGGPCTGWAVTETSITRGEKCTKTAELFPPTHSTSSHRKKRQLAWNLTGVKFFTPPRTHNLSSRQEKIPPVDKDKRKDFVFFFYFLPRMQRNLQIPCEVSRARHMHRSTSCPAALPSFVLSPLHSRPLSKRKVH